MFLLKGLARLKDSPAILQVIPHLGVGGAELSTVEIVDALNRVGVRALVVTQGGRMAKDVEKRGGEVISMPVATKNPLQMIRNKQLIDQLIAERNIVLVHARSRAPAWSTLLAARRNKVPFVTTYHGAYGEFGPFKRLYNSVMARGDRVIANSQFTADLVLARHKISHNILRVIYRGVELERFSRSAVSIERLEELRAKWGIAKGRKIILHPARLTRLKGHEVIINGLKELLGGGGRHEPLVIFAGDTSGRDAYVSELKRKITSFNLGANAKFVGHCSDMAAAYALAHVTLIASIEPETFGRTSAEAQAMGCPVIATNIGAPPETVRAKPFVTDDKMTGWLVPPADPSALAQALGEVLALAPDSYQKLSTQAIDNTRQHFSDELMKRQTLAVYDELLGTDFVERYQ